MPKVTAKTVTRIIGINKLASELNVTRQHIQYVAAGKRHSPRIQAALAAHGIPCKPYRH